MTDPTPAAGGLTEAEREALNVAQFDTPSTLMHNPIHAAVERIIAARTEAADREAARVTAAVAAWIDEAPEQTAGLDLLRQIIQPALSSAGTDALDRERAKAAAEALREAADRFASDAPLTPQYVRDCLRADAERAVAVSPEGGGEEEALPEKDYSPTGGPVSPFGPFPTKGGDTDG